MCSVHVTKARPIHTEQLCPLVRDDVTQRLPQKRFSCKKENKYLVISLDRFGVKAN
jgi:hypothetical protein